MSVLLPTTTQSIESLIGAAWDAGCRFRCQGDKLQIAGRRHHSDLIGELRRRSDEVLPYFQPGDVAWIGIAKYPYGVWSDQKLKTCFAFDTETELIRGHEIPRLALASVSDGEQHLLIHPNDLAAFIQQHRESTICFHNSPFDVWVIDRHLSDRPDIRKIWWQMIDNDQIRDTMLLDGLYQLSKRDAYPKQRNVAQLASYYVGLSLNKSDPFRTRYGQIIGKPWRVVPRGYFEYAIKDAAVTFEIYEELVRRVGRVLSQHNIPIETIRRYGFLAEKVQVKGAISLAAVERNGMQIDRSFLKQLREGLTVERGELLQQLDEVAPGLIRRKKDGTLQTSAKTGSPSKSNSVLHPILEQIASELGEEPPRSEKTDKVTTTRDYWSQFNHPFLTTWLKFEELNKMLTFFRRLDVDQIHPRYSVMVRTGRTSCSSPNIQQLPRDGHIREGIVAPKDHSFFAIDYDQLELRTFAAVCESRYNYSRMGELIRAGIDPHCYVAAMFEGITLEDFMSWKKSDRKKYDQLRQRAKALDFGVPGGLGAKTLVQYAKATYGVTLTLEEAQQFRLRLINEAFPELKIYLDEDAYQILARQLHCQTQSVHNEFPKPQYIGFLRRILAGETTQSGSTKPYGHDRIDSVWNALRRLSRHPQLSTAIASRDTSEATGLVRMLFGSPITTLTGRIRGRVSFTAARNTPFQGLAADPSVGMWWGLCSSLA